MVAANVFMGQSDAPLLIKPYVGQLGRAGLMCVMTAGMTTISGSLMIVYASILEPVLPGIVLGHLVVAGRDVGRYLDRWLDRTGVLHLHGVRRGEDHVSLAFLDPQVRWTLWGALAAPSRPRVVTLEVFSEEDLEDSLRVLEEDWEGRGTFGVPVE